MKSYGYIAMVSGHSIVDENAPKVDIMTMQRDIDKWYSLYSLSINICLIHHNTFAAHSVCYSLSLCIETFTGFVFEIP